MRGHLWPAHDKPCPCPKVPARCLSLVPHSLPRAAAEGAQSSVCVCLRQGEGSCAGGGLTVIKTSCEVMVGLGRHPGEAEALAALGRVPCLDGAHLERGNTLHLEAEGQTSVTAP